MCWAVRETLQELPTDQYKVIYGSFNKIISIDSLRIRQQDPIADANSRGLLDLLIQFRDRNASDPRDKVYALLSESFMYTICAGVIHFTDAGVYRI